MKIKTKPAEVHITCGSLEKTVSKRQAKTMYLLGFHPLLFLTINGLECIRWSRVFKGISHTATITVTFQCHRVITPSIAVHKIVQMSYRECEQDIIQHIHGPKLYIRMTPAA